MSTHVIEALPEGKVFSLPEPVMSNYRWSHPITADHIEVIAVPFSTGMGYEYLPVLSTGERLHSATLPLHALSDDLILSIYEEIPHIVDSNYWVRLSLIKSGIKNISGNW